MHARTRTMFRLLTVLVAAGVLLPGCALGGSDTAMDEWAQPAESAPSAAPDVSEQYAGDGSLSSPAVENREADISKADSERMVIRTKTMRLEVESTSDAVSAVRDLVTKHEGVITDLQVATDTDQWLYRYDEQGYSTGDGAALRGWVTVRVPADRFAAFSDEVIALGTVLYQSEASEDVTQQHVDMAARLENLRAQEERLREFFDAAKSVDDMIKVEQELSRVRGEIESLDAQVKYLERQAAMATVTIELTEEKPIVRPEGDTWGFRDAITSGFRGAANVITFGIAILIATAPLWILGIIVFLIIRAIVRRRRARSADSTMTADSTPSTPTTPAPGDDAHAGPGADDSQDASSSTDAG